MPSFVTSCACKVYTHRAGRGKPVRLCILAFSLVFTAYLSNAVVSGKSPLNFLGSRSVVLKVPLIGRLVAFSARISVDTHTHTDRQTDNSTTVTLPCISYRNSWVHNAFFSRSISLLSFWWEYNQEVQMAYVCFCVSSTV